MTVYPLRRKRRKSILTAASIAAVLAAWTVWGNVTVGVTRYTVTSSRLPASFDRYRIVVVSDLHNAEFGEKNSRLIRLIEEEHPDMIAITGDLVDSKRTDLETAGNLVRRLADIAPCCFVTGNHEAWIGERYQELERMLLDAGAVVLHDRAVPLTRNGETMQLVGLDDPDCTDRDPGIQESMLETRLSSMHLTDEYCVLLSHRPEAFGAYVAAHVDLVLSGHAHGGQFRLPLIGGIVAPNQGLFPKYDAGLYAANRTIMIVSRGLGNSVIPIRLNNRPEIVSVELIRGG